MILEARFKTAQRHQVELSITFNIRQLVLHMYMLKWIYLVIHFTKTNNNCCDNLVEGGAFFSFANDPQWFINRYLWNSELINKSFILFILIVTSLTQQKRFRSVTPSKLRNYICTSFYTKCLKQIAPLNFPRDFCFFFNMPNGPPWYQKLSLLRSALGFWKVSACVSQ